MPTRGPRPSARARRLEIVGRRDLRRCARLPARRSTGCPGALGQHRLVGGRRRRVAERNGVGQHVAPESLRRLREPDLFARQSSRSRPCASGSTRLTVSRDRHGRHGRAGASAPPSMHAIDQRARRQTAAPRRGRARRRRRPAAPRARRATESCRRVAAGDERAGTRRRARPAPAPSPTSSGGSTTTSSADARMPIERVDAALQHRRPPRSSSCFGTSPPMRVPRPAATMMTPTDMRTILAVEVIDAGPDVSGRIGVAGRPRRQRSTRSDALARQRRRASTDGLRTPTPARRSRPARASWPVVTIVRAESDVGLPNGPVVVGQRQPAGDVDGVLADAGVLLAGRGRAAASTGAVNPVAGRTARTATATRASTS